MAGPIEVVYFSDVLCVWAYAGQARLDEVRARFGERVRVRYRFLSVYGDVPTRIETHGQGPDKAQDYARRMRAVAGRFEHVGMHPSCFTEVVPRSSNQAHLVLCAARQLLDPDSDAFHALVRDVRFAFFARGEDVGRLSVLLALTARHGLDPDAIRARLEDGAAMASLSADLAQKEPMRIEGSPTYVLDGGREKLYGNVGYRVIEAVLDELLTEERRGGSWC